MNALKIFLASLAVTCMTASCTAKQTNNTQNQNTNNPTTHTQTQQDMEEPTTIFNGGYVNVFKLDGMVSVYFNIEDDKVMEIGDKMNEINEYAYMNGEGWTSFLIYYMDKNAPELLEEIDFDPEAGTFAAYWPESAESEKKAMKLAKIIKNLIENEQTLYSIVREHGNEIEWYD